MGKRIWGDNKIINNENFEIADYLGIKEFFNK